MVERDRLGGDTYLAESMRNKNVVIAQTPTTQNREPDAVRRGVAMMGEDPREWTFNWPGALSPIKGLADVAAGVGVAATTPELDGVVRRMPIIVGIGQDGKLYPNLPLEALRVATGEKSYQVKTTEAGVEKVRISGQAVISTDAHARVWLRWNRSFERMEATQLDTKKLAGKIVVIGLSAEGLGGIIGTPRGEVWAHDLQAQAIQTLIDGSSPVRLPYADLVELGVLALLALIIAVCAANAPIWSTAVVLASIGTAAYLTDHWLWIHYAQLWDIAYLMVALTLVASHALLNRAMKEFLQKQQVKKQFGTYLSPALVKQLQKHPEKLQLGGDERELSIMFTDVRGFTTISEHYGKDVQGLTKIMNRYMTAMTAKILENNGTLDKYIGDAQMAFWNAPVDEERHAHKAVKTALEMMESLDAFNAEVTAEGVPAFGMGLGINSAVVVVGNMGSSQRFDYTCLGDGVNLASRLEGQSKNYGVRIILGQRTAELVKDTYTVVELDCIAVKGKTEGVHIFTLATTNTELHSAYLESYYAGDWDKAKRLCRKLIAEGGELAHYYELMLDRMKEGLPTNWDGTYHATSK
jgi:adenylate cyclase